MQNFGVFEGVRTGGAEGACFQAPFVGRRHEILRLLATMEEVRWGKSGVCLLAGEPGIGKTRLLMELAREARAAGWEALYGRAQEWESMLPYFCFAEALRDYVTACSPEVLRRQAGCVAAQVAVVAPHVLIKLHEGADGRVFDPPVAGSGAGLIFESFLAFLRNIARHSGGLLLLLDDLHWADRPSLLLFHYLARRVADAPLLVVGAYSSTELQSNPLLAGISADLNREPHCRQISLAPLTPRETIDLIQATTDTAASYELAAAIHEITRGNPLLAVCLAQQMCSGDENPAGLAAAGAHVHWTVPKEVRAAVESRVARLDPGLKPMLRAASVLGEAFSFDELSKVSGLDAETLLDRVEAALAARLLVVEGDGYRFANQLIRRAIYADMSLARRQRLHGLAAEALKSASPREHPRRKAGTGRTRTGEKGLTPREAEVLGNLAAGLTNKDIAEKLHISLGTVQRHIANIYQKIGIRRRAEAVIYAVAHGFGGIAVEDGRPESRGGC